MNIKYKKAIFHDRGSTSPKKFLCCPNCGSTQSTVLNNCAAQTPKGIKGMGRRRKCYECEVTYRTFEIFLEIEDR